MYDLPYPGQDQLTTLPLQVAVEKKKKKINQLRTKTETP